MRMLTVPFMQRLIQSIGSLERLSVVKKVGTAYKKFQRKIKSITLVVIRMDRNGSMCDSKPCVDCLNSIRNLGIRKMYYSNENGKIEFKRTRDIHSTRQTGCRQRYFKITHL